MRLKSDLNFFGEISYLLCNFCYLSSAKSVGLLRFWDLDLGFWFWTKLGWYLLSDWGFDLVFSFTQNIIGLSWALLNYCWMPTTCLLSCPNEIWPGLLAAYTNYPSKCLVAFPCPYRLFLLFARLCQGLELLSLCFVCVAPMTCCLLCLRLCHWLLPLSLLVLAMNKYYFSWAEDDLQAIHQTSFAELLKGVWIQSPVFLLNPASQKITISLSLSHNFIHNIPEQKYKK